MEGEDHPLHEAWTQAQDMLSLAISNLNIITKTENAAAIASAKKLRDLAQAHFELISEAIG